MKITGVLYSPPMARSAYAGLKTNTRRVMKPQPQRVGDSSILQWKDGLFQPEKLPTNSSLLKHCPYGGPGDRIWVREEHYAYGRWTVGCGETKAGEDRWVFLRDADQAALFEPPDDVLPNHPRTHGRPGWYKRNSLFMLKSQCRTWLEVTRVAVERLQDVSEVDAIAEGYPEPPSDGTPHPTPITWYSGLWEHLNGPGSWAANPWVWSIHFKRIDTPKEAACPA